MRHYPERMTHPRPLDQSSKLKHVLYEIRGQALVEADRLEAEGHRILKLNTGNPAAFGFEAPFQIVRDMIEAVPEAHALQGLPDVLLPGVVRVRGQGDGVPGPKRHQGLAGEGAGGHRGPGLPVPAERERTVVDRDGVEAKRDGAGARGCAKEKEAGAAATADRDAAGRER